MTLSSLLYRFFAGLLCLSSFVLGFGVIYFRTAEAPYNLLHSILLVCVIVIPMLLLYVVTYLLGIWPNRRISIFLVVITVGWSFIVLYYLHVHKDLYAEIMDVSRGIFLVGIGIRLLIAAIRGRW